LPFIEDLTSVQLRSVELDNVLRQGNVVCGTIRASVIALLVPEEFPAGGPEDTPLPHVAGVFDAIRQPSPSGIGNDGAVGSGSEINDRALGAGAAASSSHGGPWASGQWPAADWIGLHWARRPERRPKLEVNLAGCISSLVLGLW